MAGHGGRVVTAVCSCLVGRGIQRDRTGQRGVARTRRGTGDRAGHGGALVGGRDSSARRESCCSVRAAQEWRALDRPQRKQRWWLSGDIGGPGQSSILIEAETCFLEARQIAQRQQAKSLELRAALSLSDAMATSGQGPPRLAGCWPRLMAGSPRDLTQRISRRPRRCSTNYHEVLAQLGVGRMGSGQKTAPPVAALS